ncbi:hypothetical protein LSH36_340g02031 [Paralvinella palmiformis]|uniref:Uncharacterized protein n=1 Tax=Paralvinella palmiformis TaxID=53620 RepID=A0AAD9JF76_9ANNE|nr:hypothetical protein LSH36_340g02031 [Paralvinella palmiformis]
MINGSVAPEKNEGSPPLRTFSTVAASVIMEMTQNSTTTQDDDDISIRQKDALLYIIVVLGFYSLGVICLMVKYLKEEKKDIEEEIVLENFLKNKPQTPHEQRARPSGRLALNAFNAANLLIQPSSSHGRVTFV